jgi:hypothetical protein
MSETGPYCDIVLNLLRLQQDGREAISAPTNWTKNRPLLEVPTDLDADIDQLALDCLLANGSKQGRWHFFVGSPGNGKSAAVGRLCRKLITEQSCRILECDSRTNIGEIPEDIVPHALDVYEKDNPFPTVRIVQDASVVKNPYGPKADPADDLLEALDDAWQRGMSLIVCTNRGVIESALGESKNAERFKEMPWFKSILKPLADPTKNAHTTLTVTSKKSVFETIAVSVRHLDSHSLLLGKSKVFQLLVEEACKSEKWTACDSCSAKMLCPFRANQTWLAQPEGRKQFVGLLRRAEVFSTQVIVFREALALISYVLAGCARDYAGDHPCDWVRRLASKEDFFGLASRRIHMCLFSSPYPSGLEANPVLRLAQTDALSALAKELATNAPCRKALECALQDKRPSTDVGISRLLGIDGVFTRLDAINGPLSSQFFDRWDGNYDFIASSKDAFICQLDRKCATFWSELENQIENMPTAFAPETYWAVRRWSSQYTLHLGAYIAGKVSSGEELDDFAELLELLWKDSKERSPDEKVRLKKLKQMIETLLERQTGDLTAVAGISISKNVRVAGQWVARSLVPNVEKSPASGSLTIAIHFGTARHHATLAAPTYLWLRLRAKGIMDQRCLSDDLVSEAMDAKSRALASSEYSFCLEDVEVHIDGDRETFSLTRDKEDGEVIVNAERKS